MKLETIKTKVEKATKKWTDENLSEESIESSVIEFLEGRKEEVMLLSLGFKRDSWSNDVITIDRYRDCIVTKIINEKCHKIARDWLLENIGLLKEIQLAPKTLQSAKKIYKETLVSELGKLARDKAENDAQDIYSKIVKDSLSKISEDFESGEIDIRGNGRY